MDSEKALAILGEYKNQIAGGGSRAEYQQALDVLAADPVPTQWAYDRVSEARTKWQARAEREAVDGDRYRKLRALIRGEYSEDTLDVLIEGPPPATNAEFDAAIDSLKELT